MVNDYIGVSGGYLGDFTYRTHEAQAGFGGTVAQARSEFN